MAEGATVQASVLTTPGLRKNGLSCSHNFTVSYRLMNDKFCTGKQWHLQKSAFQPKTGQTSYEKRTAERKATAVMKAKEKKMKDEKEEERQVRDQEDEDRTELIDYLQKRIQAIKDKRAAKEEKERYEKMAEKMHRKRVERLKRREKRNKLLKS